MNSHLTATEDAIYSTVKMAGGRVVSPRELVALMYGTPQVDIRSNWSLVRVHVCNLRRKLGHEEGGRIRSMWGRGYYWADEALARESYGPQRVTSSECQLVQRRVQAQRRAS